MGTLCSVLLRITTMSMILSWLLLAGATTVAAQSLPSCETDTESHCLGEGSDMSPKGIAACLEALGADGRSDSCNDYLSLLSACKADIEDDGICSSAHRDGETMACLVQRVKPADLSSDCAAALPQQAVDTSLSGTFWKDGKRHLEDDEVAQLNEDDRDTYKRWVKKKGSKNAKSKDRSYAVKEQKKFQATKYVTIQATAAATKAVAAGESGAALTKTVTAAAKTESEKAIAEDLTKTLKPFSKKELADIAKAAIKDAKSKKEL